MEVHQMKFKVVEKVVATEEEVKKYALDRIFTIEDHGFIAYKITVGLLIVYVTAAVYEQGVSANVIEAISEEVPEKSYVDMRRCRGMVVNHRMSYALRVATLEYLQQEMERASNEFKIVTVKAFETVWYKEKTRLQEPVLNYIEEIKVDLFNRVVLYNNSKPSNFDSRYFSVFHGVTSYNAFLDRLAYELDREFMNSRNLYDKFAEVGFYEVDCWLQQLYKFEFVFE